MRISTAGLIASIFALAAAACGRSVSDPLTTNLRTGRDLALSAGQTLPAFASAMELNRAETEVAYEAKSPVTPSRPAPKSPPAGAPALPPAAEPVPADVEVEFVPAPVQKPAQMMVVPVSSNTATFAATTPEPVAGGTVVALEPGQSVTMLASPISGATATDNNIEMPASTRRGGITIGGGDCPHGGGGGVIGILR